MNPILEYKLRRLGRHGKPSKDFVARLGTRFSEQKAINYSFYTARLTTAFGLVLIILGIGTSTYAYASDEVTPDHPLYGIRQVVEQAEETVAITPAWKERVVKKHLERKQKEIVNILEKNPELKERPEGATLQKVESILKKGIEEKQDPEEIRKEALREVRSAERENKDEEHPKAQTRLRKIERRLENMKKVRKED